MKLSFNISQWEQQFGDYFVEDQRQEMAELLISPLYTQQIVDLIEDETLSNREFIKQVVLSSYYQLK